ncbi:MAG: transglutaminase-like domain-containing protein, partial [Clostridium sp.]
PWLKEQLPHIRFTPYLSSIVAEVVGNEENPLLKAKKIYEYITSHVMYSFVRTYFTIIDIPEYAASGGKGDCGIQALLFITMCRIAGIPARWQAGLYAHQETIGCHDWAQFYIEPYGWLYADCSFGGGAYRDGAIERREFYFGNLDPFRIPCNSEFAGSFSPAMKQVRNDPYDNQTGEVEYGDSALRFNEYDTIHKVLEIREIEGEYVGR